MFCRTWHAGGVAGVLLWLGGSAAGGLSATESQAAAQEAAASRFRSRADYVEVDAYVTDAQGRFVRDLRREEFQLLEDGTPQDLIGVQLIDLRHDGPAPAGEASDVASNARHSSGALYVIVVDDLHILPERTALARKLGADLVRHVLGPADLAAVILTSGPAGGQDFTGDQRALLDAVSRATGRKVPSPALSAGPGQPGEDANAGARVAQGRAAIDTLARVAAAARELPGHRKALVWISEGIDVDLSPRPNARRSPVDEQTAQAGREFRDRLAAVMATANGANLSVYAFDPRGITGRLGEGVDIPAGSAVTLATLLDEQRMAQDALRVLAAGTGGAAFVDTSDLGRAFETIREENSTYYLLGYRSPRLVPDGRLHQIEVRVLRPGVTVRARRGYTSTPALPPAASPAPPGVSPDLLEALNDPRPMTGLTLSASAGVFQGTDGVASVLVLVQVEAGSLSCHPSDAKTACALELVVVPVDPTGAAHNGERRQLDLALSRENAERVASSGLLVPVRLALGVGRRQLRIGARDGGNARIGTLRYELDVPDFTGAVARWSTPLLASSGTGGTPVVDSNLPLVELLGGAPTLLRTFTTDETLAIAGELYGADAAARVVATLRRADGASVVELAADAGGTTGTEARASVASIPLGGLSPGLYRLALEARTASATVRSADILVTVCAAAERADPLPPPAPAAPPLDQRVSDPADARKTAAGDAARAAGAAASPGAAGVGDVRAAATVEEIVERAGRYLARYGEQLSLVIGREDYVQNLGTQGTVGTYKRLLVSEFALVGVQGEWLGFRDVFEVDGTSLRDRQDRLRGLFLDVSDSAVSQARRISDESARYNLGAIERNFNTPTTALFFLEPANAPRLRFTKGGEDTIDGTRVWKLGFEETGRPTIIRTSAGKDTPVQGTFWIDPVEGRVFRTQMGLSAEVTFTEATRIGAPEIRRERSTASITVRYRHNRELNLLLPVEMLETYEGPAVNRFTGNEEMSRVNCRAVYSEFKRFETRGRVVK